MLDLEKVAEALQIDAPLHAELIVGGRSNLTYRVTDGMSQWVVRRPPLGHVLATAHDMAREFRVITALGPTAVPVPRTVALGDGFYVMELIEGTVLREAGQARALGTQWIRALSRSLVDVLADLHEVDPRAVGLADFGRPEGFLERQLRRWRAQLDASRTRPLPGIDELHTHLSNAVPAPPRDRSGIVHGDYRLDNVIVGADGSIAAVLDWEMATLGDPLTDLGLLLVYWDSLPTLPAAAISSAITPDAGFPSGTELVDRYAARRGTDLTDLAWYVAFGHFKLAVIIEGIHARYVAGKTVGDGFAELGVLVPDLVRLGHDALREK